MERRPLNDRDWDERGDGLTWIGSSCSIWSMDVYGYSPVLHLLGIYFFPDFIHVQYVSIIWFNMLYNNV